MIGVLRLKAHLILTFLNMAIRLSDFRIVCLEADCDLLFVVFKVTFYFARYFIMKPTKKARMVSMLPLLI